MRLPRSTRKSRTNIGSWTSAQPKWRILRWRSDRKDNIMKMTDGLFHKVYDEIAAEYPEIQNEHWIVDIGAAKMADTPVAFRSERQHHEDDRRSLPQGLR